MLVIIVISIFLSYLFYTKLVKINNYWYERNVPYVKPTYFLGNFAERVFRLKPLDDIVKNIYNKHPNESYVGFYQFLRPSLMIRNPEVIKQILVKDFDVFPEHNQLVPVDVDPLWAKNLFSMSSKNGWQGMRSTLSPFFTSNKMRTMFTLMQECSKHFIEYLNMQDGLITLEMKDLFSRFANDVIGSTAFGVTCNSLKDRNNQFYLMGKEVTNFTGLKGLKFFAYTLCPSIARLLGIKIVTQEVGTFFRSLIKETLKFRSVNKIARPDMIHLLMESRKYNAEEGEDVVSTGFVESDLQKHVKKHKLEISDDDITAQALLFFFAGFETVSTALSYIAYELALNPKIQKKLYGEIKEIFQKNIEITYDLLLSMKYLDNVVLETLRLHSPVIMIDRKCTKPYVIEAERPGEKSLQVEKGSLIWIPIRAIHRDEKYFPDAEKFNPNRFSNENKNNIKPFTYFPFGVGPRNCIGSRFALLEIKLVIVHLLLNYELVAVDKTEIPLKLCTTHPNAVPGKGIWLGLIKRTK